jgi:thiamine-monophosphate kinase
MRIKDIGEIDLIERLAKGIPLGKTVVEGIGDDAAVIKWRGEALLLFTCDMLIEDVHFRLAEATPFQIGWKALGRALSDVAAMGGRPRYALVSLGIDRRLPVSFLTGVYKGMKTLARRFGVNIVGGDTARSRKLIIDVSAIGEVERSRLVRRGGAKIGDVILVTGSIGGSKKGRHLSFLPRVEEARFLVENHRINAMIDISDGLILDLWRILTASSTGARLYENTIPVSTDAVSLKKAIQEGEDFELLFTMSAREARRFFETGLTRMKTPVTLIGEVMDARYGYRLRTKDGRESRLEPKGYLHF